MPKKIIKKTEKVAAPSTLSNWLFNAPMKFTGLFVVIFALVLVLANLLFSAKSIYSFIWAPRFIFLLLSIGGAFSLYKLIRWTPDDNLDQKSFAILNITQGVLSIALMAVAGLIALSVHNGSLNQLIFLGAIALLLLIFLSAIWVLFLKSIYCRARMQGVPRWKLLWSIPFGISLFWYPGFLIKDGKNKNQAIGMKSKLLNKLGDWIVASGRNTIIAFSAIIIVDALVMMNSIRMAVGFAVVSLILMLGFVMWKKLRDNVGTWYATFAVALNIGVIVALIWSAAMTPKPKVQVLQEQITITETTNNE
ncbi:MAG: hypothetical protein FWE50_01160 [Alphaproteobacteria bacterium]|nr:hypothetical protein [Alphaproteobacteria bacterium]